MQIQNHASNFIILKELFICTWSYTFLTVLFMIFSHLVFTTFCLGFDTSCLLSFVYFQLPFYVYLILYTFYIFTYILRSDFDTNSH